MSPQVEAWLAKKGWSCRIIDGLLDTQRAHQFIWELAGVRDRSKVATTMYASIPDTGRALFENTRIDLYYFFDSEENLVAKYFDEVCISL